MSKKTEASRIGVKPQQFIVRKWTRVNGEDASEVYGAFAYRHLGEAFLDEMVIHFAEAIRLGHTWFTCDWENEK